MFKIIKFDKKVDSLKKLNQLVLKSYSANKKFFGKDIEKLKIAFMYSRAEMNKFCGRETPQWHVGTANYSGTIAIFSPSVFEKVSNHQRSDFLPVLTHEIAHAFIHENYKFKIPAWLAEGVPGYVAEQYKTRRMYKKNIQKFEKIHTKEDWRSTPNYPQAYSFTKYLIDRFGKRDFLKFFSVLDENESFNEFTNKTGENLKVSFSDLKDGWLSQL